MKNAASWRFSIKQKIRREQELATRREGMGQGSPESQYITTFYTAEIFRSMSLSLYLL